MLFRYFSVATKGPLVWQRGSAKMQHVLGDTLLFMSFTNFLVSLLTKQTVNQTIKQPINLCDGTDSRATLWTSLFWKNVFLSVILCSYTKLQNLFPFLISDPKTITSAWSLQFSSLPAIWPFSSPAVTTTSFFSNLLAKLIRQL